MATPPDYSKGIENAIAEIESLRKKPPTAGNLARIRDLERTIEEYSPPGSRPRSSGRSTAGDRSAGRVARRGTPNRDGGSLTRGGGGPVYSRERDRKGVNYGPDRPDTPGRRGVGDTLDRILELMTKTSSYSSGLPDKGAFLSPYDQAEKATRDVYAQVVPSIDNTFAQLQTGIQGQGEAFNARMGELQAAAQQLQAQQAEQVAGQQTNVAVDPAQLAGSLAAEVAANTNANVQDQGTRNAADLAFLGEIGAMGNADTTAQASSAQAVGAGARSTADTTLQQALAKIGLGRAQAEADYASQAAQAQRSTAEFRLREREQNAADAESALGDWEKVQEDILKKATVNEFDSEFEGFRRQRPMASADVMGLIQGAGRDRTQLNYSMALSALEMAAGLDPSDESWVAKHDVPVLAEWLRRYYMGQDIVDPNEFQRLGGDPRFLG